MTHADDRLDTMLAKAEIAELLLTERMARDEADWERMGACFHPDSHLDLSWFSGSGAEFVAASRRSYAAGNRNLHLVSAPTIRLHGARAVALANLCIVIPITLHGVEAVLSAYCRLHEHFARHDQRWGMVSMTVVYLWGALVPRDPAQRIDLDAARLARFRKSYALLAYVEEERGGTINPDLPGIDRPETIDAVRARDDAWLTAS